MKNFLGIVVLSALILLGCKDEKPKYVFLFIGDGMGVSHIKAAEELKKIIHKDRNLKLTMSKFPYWGVTTTEANNRLITDSAAAGTAISSGYKTNVNYIGLNPKLEAKETISELAHKNGYKVGIVSSVSIDHATPASFYAHQKHRELYHEIAFDLLKSNFEFFGGGGLIDPTGLNSTKPLGDFYKQAKVMGYKVIRDKNIFLNLKNGDSKIIAINENLDSEQAIPYNMDLKKNDLSLKEITQKAIEVLFNKKGFFLMVEGGKIDWASHMNDAATAITETIAFDDSIKVAYEFYKRYPEDTLIVVTSDHETGGLTIGYSETAYESYLSLLMNQKCSVKSFETGVLRKFIKKPNKNFNDIKNYINRDFGLTFGKDANTDISPHDIQKLKRAFLKSLSKLRYKPGSKEYLEFGEYDPMAIAIVKILNKKAGVGWTTFSHTATPIPTAAIGKQAHNFSGKYDNTDIFKKIRSIMKF